MNPTGAAILRATALMVATVASAQAQSRQVPSTGQVTAAPSVQATPRQGTPQSRPLFTIGHLEVHLWAPMELPYDANMNRTFAADPVWGQE